MGQVEILPSNRQQVERKFELSFPEGIWKNRSESVKNLLRKMLEIDPMRRWVIAKSLNQQSDWALQLVHACWSLAYGHPATALVKAFHDLTGPWGNCVVVR